MGSSREVAFSRGLLYGLVAGTYPLVCAADLNTAAGRGGALVLSVLDSVDLSHYVVFLKDT